MPIPLIVRARLVHALLQIKIRQRKVYAEAGALCDGGATLEEPDACGLVAEGGVDEGLVGGDWVYVVEEDAAGGGGGVEARVGAVCPGVGEGRTDGLALFDERGGGGGGKG